MKFIIIFLFNLLVLATGVVKDSPYKNTKIIKKNASRHIYKYYYQEGSRFVGFNNVFTMFIGEHNNLLKSETNKPVLITAKQAQKYLTKIMRLYTGGMIKKITCKKFKRKNFSCSSINYRYLLSRDGNLSLD